MAIAGGDAEVARRLEIGEAGGSLAADPERVAAREHFAEIIAGWPVDIRTQLLRLLQP